MLKTEEKWTEAGSVAACEAGIHRQRSFTPLLIPLLLQEDVKKHEFVPMKVRSTQTSVQPESLAARLTNVLQVSEALKKTFTNKISRLPFKDSTNQLFIVCSRREKVSDRPRFRLQAVSGRRLVFEPGTERNRGIVWNVDALWINLLKSFFSTYRSSYQLELNLHSEHL